MSFIFNSIYSIKPIKFAFNANRTPNLCVLYFIFCTSKLNCYNLLFIVLYEFKWNIFPLDEFTLTHVMIWYKYSMYNTQNVFFFYSKSIICFQSFEIWYYCSTKGDVFCICSGCLLTFIRTNDRKMGFQLIFHEHKETIVSCL